MNELSWLQFLKNKFQYSISENLLGIGDDVSIFPYSKKYSYVFTKNLLVENIHFTFQSFDFKQLGYRSLAVNLSDLSAMAAKPKYLFVGFAFQKKTPTQCFIDFYKGIEILMKRYNIKLLGGDSSSSKQGSFISISLIGIIHKNEILSYPKTQVNDSIYVTGNLGSASLAVEFLTTNKTELIKKKWTKLFKRYQNPPLRIHLMKNLVKNMKIHSAIDLSDGLGIALHKMLYPSKLGALINGNHIPVSPWLRNPKIKEIVKDLNFDKNKNSLKIIKKKSLLYGGEDYEILFTSPEKIEKIQSITKIKITKIGIIDISNKIKLQIGHKQEIIKAKGFEHF